jgi:hypothetical protein
MISEFKSKIAEKLAAKLYPRPVTADGIVHHTPARQADAFTGATNHPGNIARDGAPKKNPDVMVKPGMRSRRRRCPAWII